MVICLERGANDLHMVQLIGLPFWCRLTQVVLEKRLLNGCSAVVVVPVDFISIWHWCQIVGINGAAPLPSGVWWWVKKR